MGYRQFDPRIPQEKHLGQQIYTALEGDVISEVINRTGAMQHRDDSLMRAGMEVTSIKVEKSVMPKLYRNLYSVKDKLGFTQDIEFYITNSPQVNACTYFGTTPGRPLIVELNSSLIELMDEDELRFVIGHELGHQIDGNYELTKLINFVYPNLDTMSPLLLQMKVRFWQQLCELVADRYGFLAVEDLNVCVSAFFKMHSGLNLRRMDIDIQAFIDNNRRLLRYYTDGKFLSLDNYDHPVDAIRVEALNLFATSQSRTELDDGMNILISAMSRMCREEVDEHMPYFIASAGLLMANADGNITQDEVESILISLSSFEMFPQDVLDEVFKSNNPVAYFNKSVSKILELKPDAKESLFQYIIDLVMVDNKLKREEIELMKQIGTTVFGYSEDEIMVKFAISIRQSFRPKFSAIC
ncbi:MAG: M48 family metalloprotease [Candidatus Cryptobacteroides sp.]